MQVEDQEPEGREPELITPEDFLQPSPYPQDAQRMGFDRYTGGDAAMLAMVSALDGRKQSHRLFAIAMLVLVVGCFALTIWGQFHA